MTEQPKIELPPKPEEEKKPDIVKAVFATVVRGFAPQEKK